MTFWYAISVLGRRALLQATPSISRNIFEYNKYIRTTNYSSGTHFLLASTSAITQEKLDKWRKEFYSEPKNVLAQNVCSRFDPLDVCLSRQQLENTNHVFTYKVKIMHTLIDLSIQLINIVFPTGRNGGQTSDKPKELGQMLVVRSFKLHTCAIYERT